MKKNLSEMHHVFSVIKERSGVCLVELHHVGEICSHLDPFELQYGQSLLLILVLKLRSFMSVAVPFYNPAPSWG